MNFINIFNLGNFWYINIKIFYKFCYKLIIIKKLKKRQLQIYSYLSELIEQNN